MVGAGRVESMAIHPTNSNIMYAAAVEGGVWKTTDGGATWIPTMDNMPSLNTTSVAISKSNPSILFATLSSGYINLLMVRQLGLKYMQVILLKKLSSIQQIQIKLC
jgi:hypothetical protein